MGCLEATKAQVSWRHQGVVHGGVGMSSSPQKTDDFDQQNEV